MITSCCLCFSRWILSSWLPWVLAKPTSWHSAVGSNRGHLCNSENSVVVESCSKTVSNHVVFSGEVICNLQTSVAPCLVSPKVLLLVRCLSIKKKTNIILHQISYPLLHPVLTTSYLLTGFWIPSLTIPSSFLLPKSFSHQIHFFKHRLTVARAEQSPWVSFTCWPHWLTVGSKRTPFFCSQKAPASVGSVPGSRFYPIPTCFLKLLFSLSSCYWSLHS